MKICTCCGTRFFARRSSKQFCSDSCRVNYFQKSKRLKEKYEAALKQQKELFESLDFLTDEVSRPLQESNNEQKRKLDKLTNIFNELTRKLDKNRLDYIDILNKKNRSFNDLKKISILSSKIKNIRTLIVKYQKSIEKLTLELKDGEEGMTFLTEMSTTINEEITELDKSLNSLQNRLLDLDKRYPPIGEGEKKGNGMSLNDLKQKIQYSIEIPGEIGQHIGQFEFDRSLIFIHGTNAKLCSQGCLAIIGEMCCLDIPIYYYSLELGTSTLFARMARKYKMNDMVTFYDHFDQRVLQESMEFKYEGIVVLDGVDGEIMKRFDLAKWRTTNPTWTLLVSKYKLDKRTSAAWRKKSTLFIEVKEDGKKGVQGRIDKNIYGEGDGIFGI